MDLLPPPHERPWLLEQLAELIVGSGREPLLRRPLVEPSDLQALDDDPRGLLALLQRHVGLDGMALRIEELGPGHPRAEDSPAAASAASRHAEAPLWFAGLRDEALHFGLLGAGAGRGGLPVARVAAHEMTHAWRTSRKLVAGDRDLDELLCDLTAVYLGLGLLVFPAEEPGAARVVELGAPRLRRLGALRPEALAWLLAAQLALRDVGPRERQRLLGQLPDPHARRVQAAFAEVSRPGRLDELRALCQGEPVGKVVPLPVAPLTVRRVEGAPLVVGLVKGLVLGAIAGFFTLRLLGPLSAIVCFVVGGALGATWGRRSAAAFCSGCGADLQALDTTCPGCGGQLR